MSAVVLWLVFAPVTRKTRAQLPAAELFDGEDSSPSPRLWEFARLARIRHFLLVVILMHIYNMVPRGLEPRTLRLLAVCSNQLSYETN